jgi:hypothetical protein
MSPHPACAAQLAEEKKFFLGFPFRFPYIPVTVIQTECVPQYGIILIKIKVSPFPTINITVVPVRHSTTGIRGIGSVTVALIAGLDIFLNYTRNRIETGPLDRIQMFWQKMALVIPCSSAEEHLKNPKTNRDAYLGLGLSIQYISKRATIW